MCRGWSPVRADIPHEIHGGRPAAVRATRASCIGQEVCHERLRFVRRHVREGEGEPTMQKWVRRMTLFISSSFHDSDSTEAREIRSAYMLELIVMSIACIEIRLIDN